VPGHLIAWRRQWLWMDQNLDYQWLLWPSVRHENLEEWTKSEDSSQICICSLLFMADLYSVFTVSKYLAWFMKAKNRLRCCSRHFSCNKRATKVMSIVLWLRLNPHSDCGRTVSATCERRRWSTTVHGQDLPSEWQHGYATTVTTCHRWACKWRHPSTAAVTYPRSKPY